MKTKILNLVMLLGFIALSNWAVAQTTIYVNAGETLRVACWNDDGVGNNTTLDTDCQINLSGNEYGDLADTIIATGPFYMEAGNADADYLYYTWSDFADEHTHLITDDGQEIVEWIVSKYNQSTGYEYVGFFWVRFEPVVNTYDAIFTVTDGTNPIVGATVSVTGEGNQSTNGTGNCTFADLADGTYNYSVTASGYDTYNSSFTVAGGNVAVPVTMTETAAPTYDVTFNVTDNATGDPINGANVTFDGTSQSTNSSGVTVFNNYEDGTYNYSVVKSGYDTETGSVTVGGSNVTKNVAMTETAASVYVVNFSVNAASKGITGATVTLTGYGDQTTDGSGNCSFTDIPDGTYAYSVVADNYEDENGQITVSGGNVNEIVYMDPLAVNGLEEIELNVYPNPVVDYLTIDSQYHDVQWELYSITGQVVLRGDGEKIDMYDLNTGYYVLKVITESGIVNKKILKQ